MEVSKAFFGTKCLNIVATGCSAVEPCGECEVEKGGSSSSTSSGDDLSDWRIQRVWMTIMKLTQTGIVS